MAIIWTRGRWVQVTWNTKKLRVIVHLHHVYDGWRCRSLCGPRIACTGSKLARDVRILNFLVCDTVWTGNNSETGRSLWTTRTGIVDSTLVWYRVYFFCPLWHLGGQITLRTFAGLEPGCKPGYVIVHLPLLILIVISRFVELVACSRAARYA